MTRGEISLNMWNDSPVAISRRPSERASRRDYVAPSAGEFLARVSTYQVKEFKQKNSL